MVSFEVCFFAIIFLAVLVPSGMKLLGVSLPNLFTPILFYSTFPAYVLIARNFNAKEHWRAVLYSGASVVVAIITDLFASVTF